MSRRGMVLFARGLGLGKWCRHVTVQCQDAKDNVLCCPGGPTISLLPGGSIQSGEVAESREQCGAVAAHRTIRSRRQTGRARARGRAGDRLAPSTAERPSRLRTPDLHTHQQGNLRLRAPRTDAAPQLFLFAAGRRGRCSEKRRLFVVTSTEHRNRQGAASVAVVGDTDARSRRDQPGAPP